MKPVTKILVCLIAMSVAACAPRAKRDGLSMAPADTGADTAVEKAADATFATEHKAELKNWSAEWDHKKDGAAWTTITARAIHTHGQGLLNTVPTDAAAYCPRYAQMTRSERAGFWIMFISAMAKYESAFNPAASFVEEFENSKKEPVISRGLLQISRESSAGYGCGIEKETDLESASKNLSCTVRILARFVPADKVIVGMERGNWRGAARYWGVLRKLRTEPAIRAATRRLASCG